MNNKFIKTNPLNGALSINYVEVNDMMKNLNRAVNTRDEYFDWVKDWKIRHENVVAAIQGIRAEKQFQKHELGLSESASLLHGLKMRLRPFARELYRLRTEKKEAFKAGEYQEGDGGQKAA